MGAAPTPLGKATYVSPDPDRDWLQNVQHALYRRSNEQPDYVFQKLWGFITDLRNLGSPSSACPAIVGAARRA